MAAPRTTQTWSVPLRSTPKDTSGSGTGTRPRAKPIETSDDDDDEEVSDEPPRPQRVLTPQERALRLKRRAEARIWDKPEIFVDKALIITFAFVGTFLAAGVGFFLYALGFVPILPAVGVLPSYGIIYTLMHWLPTLMAGFALLETKSLAVAYLCWFIYLAAFTLDVFALAMLAWWIFDYAIGILPAAAVAGTTLWGVELEGLLVFVVCICDLLSFLLFVDLLGRIRMLRDRADRRAKQGDYEDDGDSD